MFKNSTIINIHYSHNVFAYKCIVTLCICSSCKTLILYNIILSHFCFSCNFLKNQCYTLSTSSIWRSCWFHCSLYVLAQSTISEISFKIQFPFCEKLKKKKLIRSFVYCNTQINNIQIKKKIGQFSSSLTGYVLISPKIIMKYPCNTQHCFETKICKYYTYSFVR